MTWQEDCSRKGLMSMVNWPQVNSGTGISGMSFQTLILFACSSKGSGNASRICTARLEEGFSYSHSLGALLRRELDDIWFQSWCAELCGPGDIHLTFLFRSSVVK